MHPGIYASRTLLLFGLIDLLRAPGLWRQSTQMVVARESIHLIGNGAGLPTKIDSNGKVADTAVSGGFLFCNDGQLAGGSGSGLFNSDLRLIGIQSRGASDWMNSSRDACTTAVVSMAVTESHQRSARAATHCVMPVRPATYSVVQSPPAAMDRAVRRRPCLTARKIADGPSAETASVRFTNGGNAQRTAKSYRVSLQNGSAHRPPSEIEPSAIARAAPPILTAW